MSLVDAHLEIDPEHGIEFVLVDTTTTTTESSSNPNTTTGTSTTPPAHKVTLTLKNPDSDGLPIAFKIKTTQPRRYLVRPNQGLILPGRMEIIQIVLVEKDKQELLRSYQTMGMIALEQGGNKDKFLIQSTTVSHHDATSKYTSYDAITELWSTQATDAMVKGHPVPAIANKKLHVRYQVISSNGTLTNDARNKNNNINNNSNNNVLGTTPTTNNRTIQAYNSTQILPNNTNNNNNPNPNHTTWSNMSKEQLIMEIQNVRTKYDELIAFSVNLTAERDMISNTLEVTKRDYKQLLLQSSSSSSPPLSRSTTTNKTTHSRGNSSSDSSTSGTVRFLFTWFIMIGMVLFISLVSLSGGIYLAQQQQHPQQTTTTIQSLPSFVQPLVQWMIQQMKSMMMTVHSSNHSNIMISDTTTTTDEF